jgi:glycosyltransferase involved in cell wall biosynthesis
VDERVLADTVTVITASLPSRRDFLAEAVESVRAQTVSPAAHLIGIDYQRHGGPATLTQLARAVRTPWLAILDDDDLLDPIHLQTLLDHAVDAEIVYSWCRVVGRGDWNPNREFSAEALREGNFIPITTMIKSTLVETIGGWRDDTDNGWWDWDFWKRALEADARFICVPVVTWTYRFHGGNVSIKGTEAE